ncbi:hypothetical protein GCM10007112_03320 [Vulcanisaeta souniana JCM 11219]|uniref:Uncharacterized protein n=1 Tax=Vulcanisaeta souniana JCM 11219 TaxID=1293586 RepID=A0A830E084_9CREN|nr:hypothetical protein GCM10007112_03320 [Vulcanisaeta souniana JCM 11219]
MNAIIGIALSTAPILMRNPRCAVLQKNREIEISPRKIMPIPTMEIK